MMRYTAAFENADTGWRQEMNDKFKPVSFDPKGYASNHRTTDRKFRIAYGALESKFAALAAFLKARSKTQRMN